MNLEEIQRAMLGVVQQPLARGDNMRKTALDGSSITAVADEIIKPNDRLTSFERLELYNRQYWYRILSALAEDFSGVNAILGDKRFEKLSIAYLKDCPSESFTLRNLGRKLEGWLRDHPEFVPKNQLGLVLDMVRLEWAEIEAFDNAEYPKLTTEDLLALGDDPVFQLQPYVRLLALDYPVDELLLSLKHPGDEDSEVASNAVTEKTHTEQLRRSSPARPGEGLCRRPSRRLLRLFQAAGAGGVRAAHRLGAGQPLSQALEHSVDYSNSSIEHVTGELQAWFANWSSLGWFSKPETH